MVSAGVKASAGVTVGSKKAGSMIPTSPLPSGNKNPTPRPSHPLSLADVETGIKSGNRASARPGPKQASSGRARNLLGCPPVPASNPLPPKRRPAKSKPRPNPSKPRVPPLKIGVPSTLDCRRPRTCPLCHIELGDKYKLARHTKQVHGKGTGFQCKICKVTIMGDKSHLSAHMLARHTGHKPFKCEFCSYKTAVAGNLKVHMKARHKE